MREAICPKYFERKEEEFSLVYNDLIQGVRYFEFYCQKQKAHEPLQGNLTASNEC